MTLHPEEHPQLLYLTVDPTQKLQATIQQKNTHIHTLAPQVWKLITGKDSAHIMRKLGTAFAFPLQQLLYSMCCYTSMGVTRGPMCSMESGSHPWPRALSPLLQAFPKGPGTLRLMRTNHAAGEEYDKGEIALFERKTCVVGGVACSEHMSKISTRCYCY